MDRFVLHNSVVKKLISTEFGIVTMENICIDPIMLESYLSNIVFNEENLQFIFMEEFLEKKKHFNILRRFVPNLSEIDLDDFISRSINEKKSFYSFFAEAILSLVLRDLYEYDLSSAVVDINDTLVDGHTGVDACMYSDSEQILVLGEAKFYQDFNSGIRKIINDFTSPKGFLNKLDSFKRHCENDDKSVEMIIKFLDKDEYEEITMQEFLNFELIFSGFVLHEHSGNIEKYEREDFYDDYLISAKDIKKNINAVTNEDTCESKYRIILLHLPVNSKKELIKKIINEAYRRMDGLRKESE